MIGGKNKIRSVDSQAEGGINIDLERDHLIVPYRYLVVTATSAHRSSIQAVFAIRQSSNCEKAFLLSHDKNFE